MCGGSRPKAPKRPKRVAEAPRAPDVQASQSSRAGAADRRRRASAGGMSPRSTIQTGPRGVQTQGMVATKTLLGQ